MKTLGMSFLALMFFFFLVVTCTKANNHSEEITKLKVKNHNLQFENERLKELNESLTVAKSALIREKTSLYKLFSNNSKPLSSFLFSNSTSFPFGYIRVTGYYKEILISNVDSELKESCPFFVVSKMDSDLSDYFWSMINKGNSFNQKIDNHIGLSINLDDTSNDILKILKSSSTEVTIIGYLRDLELGGNMSLHNNYFTPIAFVH